MGIASSLTLLLTVTYAITPALAPPAPPARIPALASAQDFRVDVNGDVLWVDSFGTIRRNGASTGYRPADGRFDVDDHGNVIFVDSFGYLNKNDHRFGRRVHDHAYGWDRTGNVYWVDDWDMRLMREDENLGYKASGQSAIRGDSEGNVYYVNPDTRTLWRNGDDTGVYFLGLDFQVSDGGQVFYRTWVNQNQCQMWSLDAGTGARTFIGWAHNPPFFELDRQGHIWYVGPWGQVIRDQAPMHGLVYYGNFQLDEAGNVYTARNGEVQRNNVPTGYRTVGLFRVSGAGDVYCLTDTTWGTLQKNGSNLGFSLRKR